MAGEYLIKVKATLDQQDAKQMEAELNGRFTRVANKFGSALKKGLKRLSISGLVAGAVYSVLNDIDKMEQGVFEPQGDYLPLEGEATVSVTCKPMDFLICYPEDGHKPGVKAADAPMTIKKAIFKVKIK